MTQTLQVQHFYVLRFLLFFFSNFQFFLLFFFHRRSQFTSRLDSFSLQRYFRVLQFQLLCEARETKKKLKRKKSDRLRFDWNAVKFPPTSSLMCARKNFWVPIPIPIEKWYPYPYPIPMGTYQIPNTHGYLMGTWLDLKKYKCFHSEILLFSLNF